MLRQIYKLPGAPVHDSEAPVITKQHISASLHQVLDLGVMTKDCGEKERRPAILHPPAVRGMFEEKSRVVIY